MKNKLSYTAIEKYLTCPKMYFLYYIRGIREKFIGSALPFGNALDEGLNELLKCSDLDITDLENAHLKFEDKFTTQKLNGETINLASTNLLNYSNEDFDADILTEDDELRLIEKLPEGVDFKAYHEALLSAKKSRTLKGEPLKHFNYMSWISLKRKGHLFLDAYNEQVLPLIKRVISVQEEFSIENEEGDSFSGKIDLIVELHDGRFVIFDNKTSAQPYKDDQAHNSKQLASYYGVLIESGFFEKKGIPLDKLFLGYITIVKKIRKKKEPKVQVQIIINPINEALVDEVFTEYDEVNQAIHDGKFPSNRENCKTKNFGKCFCEMKDNQIVDISKNWGKK